EEHCVRGNEQRWCGMEGILRRSYTPACLAPKRKRAGHRPRGHSESTRRRSKISETKGEAFPKDTRFLFLTRIKYQCIIEFTRCQVHDIKCPHRQKGQDLHLPSA